MLDQTEHDRSNSQRTGQTASVGLPPRPLPELRRSSWVGPLACTFDQLKDCHSTFGCPGDLEPEECENSPNFPPVPYGAAGTSDELPWSPQATTTIKPSLSSWSFVIDTIPFDRIVDCTAERPPQIPPGRQNYIKSRIGSLEEDPDSNNEHHTSNLYRSPRWNFEMPSRHSDPGGSQTSRHKRLMHRRFSGRFQETTAHMAPSTFNRPSYRRAPRALAADPARPLTPANTESDATDPPAGDTSSPPAPSPGLSEQGAHLAHVVDAASMLVLMAHVLGGLVECQWAWRQSCHEVGWFPQGIPLARA